MRRHRHVIILVPQSWSRRVLGAFSIFDELRLLALMESVVEVTYYVEASAPRHSVHARFDVTCWQNT